MVSPTLERSTTRVATKKTRTSARPVQNQRFVSVAETGAGGAPTMYGANHFTCASAGRERSRIPNAERPAAP